MAGLTQLFKEFFESEKAGGLLLIFCAIISLVLSNSFLQSHYLAIWEYPLGGEPASYWINDGLMAVFFLLIGLELEREIRVGELSNLKNALLPIVCAVGGMVVPAGIYLLLNAGQVSQSGAGIPMATDIAFAIGILSLLGSRVPLPVKIFLTALAVIDDLGAIIVIAVFYTNKLSLIHLGIAFGVYAVLIVLNRLRVMVLLPYLAGGMVMWYFMLGSGVHATLTGVMLAFVIPFTKEKDSPSAHLQYALHHPVSFIIMPLFALANTCLVLGQEDFQELIHSSINLGIVAGLAIGKPLGIISFGFVAVATGLCTLSDGLNWKYILGVSLLGGIGFTMSIFIDILSFSTDLEINEAKLAILVASLLSAVAGYAWLKRVLPPTKILTESR